MNNRLSIEVLHARRPTLNYVSPPICEANFSGSGFAVVILDSFGGLALITGMRVEFVNGRFRILWDAYPEALCYNVYRADDPSAPTGHYTLVASCIPDPVYETADCPACFLITAVTLRGETPFAGPICTECPALPPGAPVITYFSAEYTANCPEGFTGSSVTIPAGTYTSLINQANADAKAQDAANTALVCTPCVLPADFYATFGTAYNADPAVPPFPPCPPGPSCPGPYGQIIFGNNTGQSVKHLRIEFSQGSPPHAAVQHDFEFFPTLFADKQHYFEDWKHWAAGSAPFDNAFYYPSVDFHVFFTLFDPLAPGGIGATIEADPQTSRSFTSLGEHLVFWAGGLPACP